MTAIEFLSPADISTISFLPGEAIGEEEGIDTRKRRLASRRYPFCAIVNTTVPGVFGDDNDWIRKTFPLLRRVAELPNNWNGENSPRPDPAIIEVAKRLLNRLEGSRLGAVPVPFVCPVAGGGVQFEWNSSRRHLEIEFLDSSTIAFLKEEATPDGEVTDTGEYPVTVTERTCQLLNWFAAV